MNFATRVTATIAIAACAFAAGASAARAAHPVRVSLLKDIYPGELDSSPSRLVRLGDAVYFEAFNPTTGGELWRTDGTKRGTRLVADITAGASSSSPRGLAASDQYVFFTVEDQDDERRLWRTDGTADGTVPVPGTEGIVIRANLVAGGGIDLFLVPDAQGFSHLWAADGDAPANDLGRLQPVPYDSAAVGGNVFLGVLREDNDAGLLSTDGTPAGSTVIDTGSALGPPFGLTELDGEVYFFVTTLGGPELWRSDGTDAGTSPVASIPGPVDRAVVAGDRLVFALDNTALWASDGTPSGTGPLRLPSGRFLASLYGTGGRAYFDLRGRLWRTDGTDAGTRRVSPRRLRQLVGFVRAGGRVLFAGKGETRGQELWQTKGTRRSTRRVSDIRPGKRDSGIAYLTSLGDRAVFVAHDPRRGRELYVAVPRR